MSGSRRRDERGALAVLVALMSLSILIIAGLVIDLGVARVTRRQAQNAADASALAAGNALYLAGTSTPDVAGALAAAKDYAAANYGVTDADWHACSDGARLAYLPDPSIPCISFDSPTAPLQVRVVAPFRGVSTPFGSMVGIDHVNVSAVAQIQLTPGGKSACGLCVVGSGVTHDLQNGDVTVSGGDVALNGDVIVKANGLVVSDGKISVEGTASGPSDGYSPAPVQHQQPVDDPLATISLPTWSSLAYKADPCGSDATSGPGIYGDLSVSSGSCTLQPGVYVITGQWSFAGGTTLDATSGVTLYFVCGTTSAPRACNAPGEAGGWLDANGGAVVKITAPSTGPTAGLAVVYDRLNTSQLRLTGNGASAYIGTIYASAATMVFDGNGCMGTNQSLIVVKDLDLNGNNACLQSNYTLDHNVWVPPSALHLSE